MKKTIITFCAFTCMAQLEPYPQPASPTGIRVYQEPFRQVTNVPMAPKSFPISPREVDGADRGWHNVTNAPTRPAMQSNGMDSMVVAMCVCVAAAIISMASAIVSYRERK